VTERYHVGYKTLLVMCVFTIICCKFCLSMGSRWVADTFLPELTGESFFGYAFPEVTVKYKGQAALICVADVAVNATTSVAIAEVDVRPEMSDIAAGNDVLRPPPVNSAMELVTVEEIVAWQLPPAISFDDMATLLVVRPTAALTDLQYAMENNLPCGDNTAYGTWAVQTARLRTCASQTFASDVYHGIHGRRYLLDESTSVWSASK